WLNEFDGEVSVLNMPTDFPRPAFQSFEGNDFQFRLSRRESESLKKIALDEEVTLFMLLLSIFHIMLAKTCAQEDIVTGTDIAGRGHADLANIIGMFVNTLALRTYPNSDKTFKNFLMEVKEKTLQAFENQDYQFEELVEQVAVERDTSRNPLFDVMFTFVDKGAGDADTPNSRQQPPSSLKISHYVLERKTSKFDLTLGVSNLEEHLKFSFEYCTKLFKETTVQRLASYFKECLSSILTDNHRKISSIGIISEEEKKKILFQFNHTGKSLEKKKLYPQLFEEQVERIPHRIAAVHGALQVTYSCLNMEAGRIACALLEQGVQPGSFVALYLKRSITMAAAIIGTFKVGAAYLPIEAEDPASRVEYILQNSEAAIVVTEAGKLETLRRLHPSLPSLRRILTPSPGRAAESENRKISTTLPPDRPPKCRGDDIAYMIYTSGTTGAPKGTLIHQAGMLNHLEAKINDLTITADDIIAQTASAAFDISVWQFLAAPIVGGSLYIIDKETVLESGKFLTSLQKAHITILESVPSLMLAFLDMIGNEKNKELKHLRWMIPTGEALTVSLVNKWFDHYPAIKLVNAYGPTEASDDITHYFIDTPPTETQQTIPVGRPLQNLHIYILDKNLALCPIGVRGEICVAGIGVGKGYWKNSQKTNAAFIPNPFLQDIDDKNYATLYKTGDIGYFREDGNVECLGRIDHQVKIRGNRIELGEIENCMRNTGDISEAVVIAKSENNGNKFLCAYIVVENTIDIPGLRNDLATRLPDYMLPTYILQIDEIPISSNGKLDRKKLPEPVLDQSREGFIAPTTSLEKELAAIWAGVLEIDQSIIGIDSGFFHLGGHSLKATVMAARIHKALDIKIPITEIFRTPTIKGLTQYITRNTGEKFLAINNVEEREYYPLASAQKRLYLLQQIHTQNTAYNMPKFLTMETGFNQGLLEETFKKLIARHESLRTSFLMHDGEPVQRVHKTVDFKIEFFEAPSHN
ncbi:MAG: amino acid adenylation domain-containing protein, partial [bacterium]|nr:amino acid adenylation domain-containing protein [bacterium]